MNYHSEHRTWPGVPWHQLPEAHKLSVGEHMRTENSYVSFFARGEFGAQQPNSPQPGDSAEPLASGNT